jgi:hypothetical protein
MFLRWLAFASALAFGCVLPSAGQADSALPIHDGLWSLELGVQPLSGSGTKIGLAAKHHIGDRSALRLGFSARVISSDGTASDSDVSGTHFGDSTDERDVTLFAHWVGYQCVDEHFAMTLDAGPTVHWRSMERLEEYTSPDVDPGAVHNYDAFLSDENLWEYGLDAQMGLEWFFARHVSLAARYGIAALRTEDRTTAESIFSSNGTGVIYHNYAAGNTDGFLVRTISPLVSLNASW